MEEFASDFTIYISVITEILAAVVVAIGLLRFVYGYCRTLFHSNHHLSNGWLRVQFGSTLAIALELLLAADILITAVAPTWEEIGKLAAIAGIRTGLNYFLDKELKELEKREELPQQEASPLNEQKTRIT